MRTFFLAATLIAAPLSLNAQTLTPGAAAIGSNVSTGTLIGVGGQVTNTQSTTSTQQPASTGSTGRRVHYPSPSWELVLPAERLNVEGVPLALFVPTQGAAAQPLAPTPEVEPAVTPAPAVSQPTVEAPAVTAGLPSATVDPSDTTTITAAVPLPEPAAAAPTQSPAAEPDLASVLSFERAAIDFGLTSTTLSPAQEEQLLPLVRYMEAQPFIAMRVVAVLRAEDSANEDEKLKARQRILAVRRHLLDQGVSVENLTFVISANASTQDLANYVLITRAGAN